MLASCGHVLLQRMRGGGEGEGEGESVCWGGEREGAEGEGENWERRRREIGTKKERIRNEEGEK